MKPFINNYEDILELLDEKVHGVEWNRFYEDRERPVPFITQNTMLIYPAFLGLAYLAKSVTD